MKHRAKPYGMKRGFTLGACLLLVGLILQLSIGPVNWRLLAWPANISFLAFLLLASFTLWLLRRKVRSIRFLASLQSAVPTMTYGAALAILMGLFPQSQEHTASTLRSSLFGLNYMLGHWSFLLIYLYMVVCLIQVVLNQAAAICRNISLFTCNTSLISHLGLAVALVCGALGSSDTLRLRMVTTEGTPERRAFTLSRDIVESPLTIELKRFIMEQYDDGMPRRFASEVEITTEAGKKIAATIDVNHPARVEGWDIYQYGYDAASGPLSQVSILELIYDPWMPWVRAGIFMMMAGAILVMMKKRT